MIVAGIVSLASTLVMAAGPVDGAPAVDVIAHVRSGSGVNPTCLREAVTGFLAGHGIRVFWPPGDLPAPAAASMRRLSLEIDLTDSAHAAVTFTDATGAPPRVRELALVHGLDQVGCESLADVIEASVLAISAEPSPAERRAPDAPRASNDLIPATPPTAFAATRPDAAFSGDRRALSVAYTLEPVASDIVQSGVELAFGSRPSAARRRDWLRVAYAFPVTASVDGASARWQSVSSGWAFSFSSRGRHAWFELAVELGLGLTFVDTVTVTAGTSTASNSHTQINPVFGSDVTFGVRLTPKAALYASLRLPIVANQPVTVEVNGMTVFQSWWMFHPALVLGARWE